MQNTATIKYTSHPLGQLLSPKQKMTNVGKHVGKLEIPWSAKWEYNIYIYNV